MFLLQNLHERLKASCPRGGGFTGQPGESSGAIPGAEILRYKRGVGAD